MPAAQGSEFAADHSPVGTAHDDVFGEGGGLEAVFLHGEGGGAGREGEGGVIFERVGT